MRAALYFLFIVSAVQVAHFSAAAQDDDRRLTYGLSFGPGLKARVADRKGLNYGIWGEVAFGMYLAYRGTSPTSMTARVHLQPIRDDIAVRVGTNEAYILETVGVLLSPEVAIPVRNTYGNSRLECSIGIGAQYTEAYGFAIQNVNGYFGGGGFDRLSDTFFAAHRKLIPFITAGIGLKLHRRATLTVRLRQDVQNAFVSSDEVTLYSSTDVRTVKLSALPTRLLLGFMIRLGKLPETY
jgi:hypothetical protein